MYTKRSFRISFEFFGYATSNAGAELEKSVEVLGSLATQVIATSAVDVDGCIVSNAQAYQQAAVAEAGQAKNFQAMTLCMEVGSTVAEFSRQHNVSIPLGLVAPASILSSAKDRDQKKLSGLLAALFYLPEDHIRVATAVRKVLPPNGQHLNECEKRKAISSECGVGGVAIGTLR
jgi:hypothetical protein